MPKKPDTPDTGKPTTANDETKVTLSDKPRSGNDSDEPKRGFLDEHVERTGRSGEQLVFGRTGSAPFLPRTVAKHAEDAWEAAKLARVTLHECRHGFKSFLDAAGITESRSDRYAGHAGTTVGDRYRHRLRGQLAEDARLLEQYLHGEAAEEVARPTGAETGASAAESASLSGIG